MTKHSTSVRQLKKDNQQQHRAQSAGDSHAPSLSTFQAKSMDSIQASGSHQNCDPIPPKGASNSNLSCFSSRGNNDYVSGSFPYQPCPSSQEHFLPSSTIPQSGSSSSFIGSCPLGDLCTVRSEGTLIFDPRSGDQNETNPLSWSTPWPTSHCTSSTTRSGGKVRSQITSRGYDGGGTHPRRSTSSWSLVKTLARYRSRLSKSADRLVATPCNAAPESDEENELSVTPKLHPDGNEVDCTETSVQMRIKDHTSSSASSASRLLKRFSLYRRKSGATAAVVHRQKKIASLSSSHYGYDQRTSLSVLASMSSPPSSIHRLSQTVTANVAPSTSNKPVPTSDQAPVATETLSSFECTKVSCPPISRLSEQASHTVHQNMTETTQTSNNTKDDPSGKWKVQQWLAWREAIVIPPSLRVPQTSVQSTQPVSATTDQPISASSCCNGSSEGTCSSMSGTGSSSSSSIEPQPLPISTAVNSGSIVHNISGIRPASLVGTLTERDTIPEDKLQIVERAIARTDFDIIAPSGLVHSRNLGINRAHMTTSVSIEESKENDTQLGDLKRFSSGRWSMSSSSGMTSAASTSHQTNFSTVDVGDDMGKVILSGKMAPCCEAPDRVAGVVLTSSALPLQKVSSVSGIGCPREHHTSLYNCQQGHIPVIDGAGVASSTNFSSLSSLNTSAGGVSTSGARLSRDSAIDLQQHLCCVSNSSSTGMCSLGCHCVGSNMNISAHNTLIVPPPPGFQEGCQLVNKEMEIVSTKSNTGFGDNSNSTATDNQCLANYKCGSIPSAMPSLSSSSRPPPPPYSLHIASANKKVSRTTYVQHVMINNESHTTDTTEKVATAVSTCSVSSSTTSTVSQKVPLPPPRRDSLRRSSLFPERDDLQALNIVTESPTNSPSAPLIRGNHVKPNIRDYDGWHKRLPYKLNTGEPNLALESGNECIIAPNKSLSSSRTMGCLSSIHSMNAGSSSSSLLGTNLFIGENANSSSNLTKLSLPKSLTSNQLKQASHTHLAAISSVSSSSNSCSPPELGDVQRLLAEANLSSLDLCVSSNSSTMHQKSHSCINPMFQEHPTIFRSSTNTTVVTNLMTQPFKLSTTAPVYQAPSEERP